MSSSFLLFQLYGPMASWGEVAVGEVRSTADHPTKSAVLGMVAAALGITREEEQKHTLLAETYGFAVRLDAPGSLMRDYHTAQVSTGKRGRGLTTRRDELEYKSVTTILSERDYRCDAYATVCMWSRNESPQWALEEIAQALNAPGFALFLGRKSCPLALPLAADVFEATSIRDAFERHGPDRDVIARLGVDPGSRVRIYWDARDTSVESGFKADQVHERWDQPRSRARWQFGRRDEAYAAVERPTYKENV